jgi:hypothetical protein
MTSREQFRNAVLNYLNEGRTTGGDVGATMDRLGKWYKGINPNAKPGKKGYMRKRNVPSAEGKYDPTKHEAPVKGKPLEYMKPQHKDYAIASINNQVGKVAARSAEKEDRDLGPAGNIHKRHKAKIARQKDLNKIGRSILDKYKVPNPSVPEMAAKWTAGNMPKTKDNPKGYVRSDLEEGVSSGENPMLTGSKVGDYMGRMKKGEVKRGRRGAGSVGDAKKMRVVTHLGKEKTDQDYLDQIKRIKKKTANTSTRFGDVKDHIQTGMEYQQHLDKEGGKPQLDHVSQEINKDRAPRRLAKDLARKLFDKSKRLAYKDRMSKEGEGRMGEGIGSAVMAGAAGKLGAMGVETLAKLLKNRKKKVDDKELDEKVRSPVSR